MDHFVSTSSDDDIADTKVACNSRNTNIIQNKQKILKSHDNKKQRPKLPSISTGLPPLLKPEGECHYALGSITHSDKPPHAGELSLPLGKPGILSGIRITASGTLPHFTRDQIKSFVSTYGGKVVSVVNDKTTLFLRGQLNVSKIKEENAKSLKIPIIDEKGFLSLINSLSGTNLVNLADQKKPIEKNPFDFLTSSKRESENVTTKKICAVEYHAQSALGQSPEMLTEKYRPQSLRELVGNSSEIEELQKFLKYFPKTAFKAVLISGPPGIGKTTSAIIAAKAARYHTIEFNASDTRGKAAINSILSSCSKSESLFKYDQNKSTRRIALILDEVDGMSSGDSGGMQALAEHISKSSIPIICICNNRLNENVSRILPLVKEIPFKKPEMYEVAERLNEICKNENIKMNRSNLFSIVKKSDGDLRAALNQIQLWRENAGQSSEKDNAEFFEIKPFEAAKIMYKESSIENKLRMSLINYDDFPILIHDLLRYNGSTTEFLEALDSVSLGDVIGDYTRSEGRWELRESHSLLSSVIPSTVCRARGGYPPKFTTAWRYQARFRDNRKALSSFLMKTSCAFPQTKDTIVEGCVDVFVRRTSMLVTNRAQELIETISNSKINYNDIVSMMDIIRFKENSFEIPKDALKAFKKLCREDTTKDDLVKIERNSKAKNRPSRRGKRSYSRL